MTDCPRFGKLFNGCKFEGRYDRSAMDPHAFGGLSIRGSEAVVAAVHAARAKTYVHDVCARCGKTVKRQ